MNTCPIKWYEDKIQNQNRIPMTERRKIKITLQSKGTAEIKTLGHVTIGGSIEIILTKRLPLMALQKCLMRMIEQKDPL